MSEEVLTMECVRLAATPSFGLPEPFQLRGSLRGDEAHWLAIHEAADRFTSLCPGLFEREFGERRDLLPEGQLYLIHRERVIGTATAWHGDGYRDGSFGRVHWVAIDPGYQGRGLAKPLVSAVLGLLRQRGYSRAYLSTDSRRPVAVALYEKFGFRVVERRPLA